MPLPRISIGVMLGIAVMRWSVISKELRQAISIGAAVASFWLWWTHNVGDAVLAMTFAVWIKK